MTLLIAIALVPQGTAGEDKPRVGRYTYEKQTAYDVKFYGTIEKMPGEGYRGSWIVNGREIIVTDSTVIKMRHGIPGEGAFIEVEGRYSGRELSAHEIEIKRE